MAFPPTDWLDWTTAEYDVGAPATSLSFERWFRNPVALAQGAPGAPRVQGVALGNVVVYAGLVTTTPIAFTGLDGIKKLVFDIAATSIASTDTLSIELSADGGATWTAPRGLAGADVGITQISRATVDCETGQAVVLSSASGAFVDTITVPSNVNAFRISTLGSGTVHAIVSVMGGRE